MKVEKEKLTLYGITDRGCLRGRDLLEQIECALKGGVTFLQLREKEMDEEEYLKEAIQVKKLCDRYHVPLIINDHVDIAQKSGADGVHLGQKDMSILQARKLLGPDKIIGASARTVELALQAQKDGADYLGSGAVFTTSSKKDAKNIDRTILSEIVQAVDIPVVAIGGINSDNVMKLAGTGIQGTAVISGIFGQEDVEEAARKMRQLVERIKNEDSINNSRK